MALVLALLGRGVAEDDLALEGTFGIDSGSSSFLINSGCGTGGGLGERGIMPRDFSAAVLCESYDLVILWMTYR